MKYYLIADEVAQSSHTLIAGATGSGKSVLLNSLLWSSMAMSHAYPHGLSWVLIDPKRVELYKWSKMTFCKDYAEDNNEIINVLDKCIATIENRYKDMRNRGLTKYDGCDFLVVIDELADLMVTCKSEFLPRVQRIAQIGRAAGFHLICATQSPSRLTIPAALTLNFDCRIALRCQSAIESRQVLGIDGAEHLPRYGQGYVSKCGIVDLWNIPMVTDDEMNERLNRYARR